MQAPASRTFAAVSSIGDLPIISDVPSPSPVARQLPFRAAAPPPLSLSHANVDPDGQIINGRSADRDIVSEGDVGLTLSTVQTYVVIIALLPGGSALASGNLKVGDLISGINGVEQNGSLERAYELLKGPAYSQVQLSVIRFDPYGAALASEICLQRLPNAPLAKTLSSLIPYGSMGSTDTPRKAGTPLATSRSAASLGFRSQSLDLRTPRASSLADSNVSVEPIPLAATVMNPANIIGNVVAVVHPYFKILEDIRRKLITSTAQRTTVLASVTEMDFMDVFNSETEDGEHGMQFREYSPRVFAVLRHFWRVDSADLLDAFMDTAIPFLSHSEDSQGSCGSVFYSPNGRFVLKFVDEAEFQWLLDLRPSYYNHFFDMQQQGIVRFL